MGNEPKKWTLSYVKEQAAELGQKLVPDTEAVITYRVPRVRHEEIRQAAYKEGTSMQKFIDDAVSKALEA